MFAQEIALGSGVDACIDQCVDGVSVLQIDTFDVSNDLGRKAGLDNRAVVILPDFGSHNPPLSE